MANKTQRLIIEKESFLPGTIIERSVPMTIKVPVRIEILQCVRRLEFSKEYVYEARMIGKVSDGTRTP